MTPHWRSQLHTAEIWRTNLNHLKGFLGAKLEGNKTLEKRNCRWEDNIKMYVTGRESEVVDWTGLTQDRGKCQSLVQAVGITLDTCQYLQQSPAKRRLRTWLWCQKQRNSETALTVSSAINCYVRTRVIDVIMSFVLKKRTTAEWVKTRVSACLLKFWTVKGIPR